MTDKNVVIIESLAKDSHAHAVAWGLRRAGATAHLIFADNFPTRSRLSISSTSSCTSLTYAGPESNFSIDDSTPATYWARRLGGPFVEGVAAEDIPAVNRESKAALQGFRQTLSELNGTTCINNLSAKRRADQKPLQLSIAREAGFRVPQTLISQSRQEIVNFAEQQGGSVIFKTMVPMVWKRPTPRGAVTVMAYSSLMTVDQLRSSTSVELCSGIYQQPLAKAYEVRVTVLGSSCFASKLYSQDRDDTCVDWRRGQFMMRNEAMSLPADIEQACVKYLRAMGLLVGCFDFVVTPDGAWFFLECNEQGQFLWQEQKCPELRLFDAFVQFAQQPSTLFRHQRDEGLSIHEYMQKHWTADSEAATGINVVPMDFRHGIEASAA